MIQACLVASESVSVSSSVFNRKSLGKAVVATPNECVSLCSSHSHVLCVCVFFSSIHLLRSKRDRVLAVTFWASYSPWSTYQFQNAIQTTKL
jgi:hypothetical protein